MQVKLKAYYILVEASLRLNFDQWGVISAGVRNYAARSGVELFQVKAQIDPNDGMLFFGLAYHLNGKFSLPLQLTTHKVHLDPAQYTDIGPDYETIE